MLLSQKQDPSRNESYNLIKRCKCVKYFWWIVDELHWMIYLSLCIFFLGHGLYIFFFFSFFWHVLWTCGISSLGMHLFSLFFHCHALWACGIPSLGMHIFSFLRTIFFDMPFRHVAYLLWVCIFYFFLYSPYFFMVTLERDSHDMSWSFICGWMGGCACYLPV